MHDLTRAQWRKSTRSNNGGNCVEVASNLLTEYGIVAVRDSKNPGPALVISGNQFHALIASIRGGEFRYE